MGLGLGVGGGVRVGVWVRPRRLILGGFLARRLLGVGVDRVRPHTLRAACPVQGSGSTVRVADQT